MMFVDENPKLRKSDRIVYLEQEEGAKTKSSTGLVDSRLFTGENRLHIVMDQKTCLWSFKYDYGAVPEALRNKQYTSFAKALNVAEKYFKTRGIKISKIED